MKKGPHKMMLESSRYDKWDRGGGGGAAGGGGGGSGWAGRERERDRERDRERERQARAHQMSQAPEPDASSLFPAPFRVNGNKDRVSQQIQNKLGDYHLAQTLLDDPSKSIGICHEPPSPAPCHPSRRERESEFKKPAHAPQNGRVHNHRPYLYNKSDAPGATAAAPAHRPPNLRIPNGYQPQSTIDSSQPPIESILREMKSLPTPLSVIEATPRKELENKFTFNPYTNRLVANPPSNDLKTPPLPKPGLDNRISNSRNSVSPDVVNKDLGLSESDDEVAATTTTRLEPILSPIGSGGSPSSGSSSPSDSESSSSSAESSGPPAPAPAPPAPAPPPPAHRSSWSLSNFAPPPASVPDSELRHALADAKGKPSPISELSISDSETSSPSPVGRPRRPSGSGAGSARSARSGTARSSNASSDDEPRQPTTTSPRAPQAAKRGRPPKKSTSAEPPKKKRGRPPKLRVVSPPPEPAPEPPAPPALHDTKTHIFRKVFTPKKGDEGGGKGGKGGKGKGGKGKGQVTIIEVTAPESGADDDERRNEEAIARVSPPPEEMNSKRREERPRRSMERTDYRVPDRPERTDRVQADRLNERLQPERYDRLTTIPDRLPVGHDRHNDRMSDDRGEDRRSADRLSTERALTERLAADKLSDKMSDKLLDRLSGDKTVEGAGGYVRAEADVGSGVKTGRGSERLEEATSVSERRMRSRLVVRVPLSRLRAETVRSLQRPPARAATKPAATPPACQGLGLEAALGATNHERGAGGTPIYYSYFERLPADVLSDEERDHKYYLGEAKRLRTAAEREQEPLQRVMLYLESVLCFVLTGRVLELELDTKRAFTIYRETIEYIKSIHSMPQRFRASPHSTFSKLDILSLRVQALLYLRMFKMYNREVKEYYKIVQEYQQKVQPACPESVSPLSPTPSPAGSVNSVGSAASASSGYCSLAHSVPAHAHHALLQLTKYYTFLYVAHELWEQADCLCRLRANQDLFIAVDRKCGPLTLFSTFRHLVQYVRHAISLLKNAPRE